jgi:hypothetical protein
MTWLKTTRPLLYAETILVSKILPVLGAISTGQSSSMAGKSAGKQALQVANVERRYSKNRIMNAGTETCLPCIF